MALRLPYRAILTLGIATLTLAAVPGGASAHTPVASRSQAAPVFVFPSNGQSFPLNGTMLFQVQPMSGAKGYLWSFVQGGAIMYQNLAWTGHLDGATYSIKNGSTAEHRLHSGAMQVWVRAWMGGSQWSATSSVTVQLKGGSQSGPGTKPKSGPPAAGTVLYQANWSSGLDGWAGSQDWKTVDGMLVNDGTNDDGSQWIIAPYRPKQADYAVEVQMQVVRTTGSGANLPNATIVVRADQQGNGYRLGLSYIPYNYGESLVDILAGDTTLAKQDYDPKGDWHTYRVEARGNSLSLIIDGRTVLQTTDNQYLSGGRVGLWSAHYVLNVRSFKVIAL